MALLQYRFCITSLTTSLALQSVVRLGACSGKQWQTVASVKEGDKAMEIGMNEVLIQSGSQIDVYSFGQGSLRNEYFLHMAIRLGKLHYALPVSFQHQTSLTRPTRCLPAVCVSTLVCPLISVWFQFTWSVCSTIFSSSFSCLFVLTLSASICYPTFPTINQCDPHIPLMQCVQPCTNNTLMMWTTHTHTQECLSA